MQQMATKRLVYIAMIAAVYTALCLALAPLSYGMVQVRVSEALTLLPVFSPIGVWGVTLGCALSNLVGFFTGANILGAVDIVFGTAATFVAAWMSRALRRVRVAGLPLLSALPPVFVNAAVIGAELALITTEPGESFAAAFVFNAVYVGIGQLVACVGFGLPMAALLERTGVAGRIFGADALQQQIAQHDHQG